MCDDPANIRRAPSGRRPQRVSARHLRKDLEMARSPQKRIKTGSSDLKNNDLQKFTVS
jgi:hypothetical protein